MPESGRASLVEVGVWLTQSSPGEIASVLGVVISLIGFGVTVWNVQRSKSAASRAEEAAKDTKQSIAAFDTVINFTNIISSLEEIRRLHRVGAWSILPDRYSALRRQLVEIRSANSDLAPGHRRAIQEAVLHLRTTETLVEQALEKNVAPKDVAKINSTMSDQIDDLHEVMLALRTNAGR